MSSHIHRCANGELARYLGSVGIAGHFARYVIARRPDVESLCAQAGGAVVGAAVCGLGGGLNEVPMCWIFAESAELFDALFERAVAEGRRSFNFDLGFADRVARSQPAVGLSVDRLYTLDAGDLERSAAVAEVIPLDRECLCKLEIPDEIGAGIGRIDELPDRFPLFGIVRDSTLVAIVEAAVRDDRYAAIQQVLTVTSCRRQGLGRKMVAVVARRLLGEGLAPTYFVAETNTSSVRLAESLGFRLDSRWGCFEL